MPLSTHAVDSYRYSWAERARAAGYPDRYAQEEHWATRVPQFMKARVELPPLEEFEKFATEGKVIPLPARALAPPASSDHSKDASAAL